MIQKLRNYFALLPIIYLFVAIFLARSKVQYVYLAAGVLVVLTVVLHYKYKLKDEIFLAHWMAVLAVIGLSSAVILSIEKIKLLVEPNHIASCSLSPIVSCSPIIASPQASAFGFANSFIGIFGFTAVFVAAMTIMAGATKLKKSMVAYVAGRDYFWSRFLYVAYSRRGIRDWQAVFVLHAGLADDFCLALARNCT